MSTQADDVEFEGVLEGSSAKAILFQADFWDKAEWIPRSQCELVMKVDGVNQECTVYVRRWLAKKNGWVE